MNDSYDVVVIGGGHAGLTAAICAAESGSSVCLLEASPKNVRGGNSKHTRNLRPLHESAAPPMEGIYGYGEYLEDLFKVTEGHTNNTLAELTLKESATSVEWLMQHGVSFQPPLSGTLQLGRTNAFFLGGGKALVNALYQCAERLNISIVYEAQDIDLNIEDGKFTSLTYQTGNSTITVIGQTLIAAAGGFEANLEWLEEAWGPAARNFLIRGTPFNRGDILKQLLDAGVQQIGEANQCHAVAIDGRAPKFDGGIVTRVDCVPFGIVVNNLGKRFYDEGEDFWPKRYAVWGRLIANQPDQVAYTIVDQKADGLYMPTVFPAVEADTLELLAHKLSLPMSTLLETVSQFNDALVDGDFDRQSLDDCKTKGLDINKTHWARSIDKPPYRAYQLRPGITFTYMGVEVDQKARVIMQDGKPSKNIFAAGEIMAGNVLGKGYLAGIGMTIGGVFGRIAGSEAANNG